jgi:hypothetical protein
LATASTVAGTDSTSLSCGVGNSYDVTFDWIVPRTGFYSVSTAGSSFDTVLGLRSDTCNGKELACVDDVAGLATSEYVGRFVENQRLAVVVDGKAGDSGSVQLHLDPITCPAQDLTEQPMPVTLTTSGGTNVHDGACGGTGRAERTYGWMAPSTGLFRFTVKSDAIAPALYVEKGGRCGGTLLGCIATPAKGYGSEVTRQLSAGDVVTIIVDSTQNAGVFTLDVQKLTGTCPNETWGTADISGTLTDGDPSIIAGSCAPSGISMMPGGVHPYADHTYAVAVGSGYRCTYHIDADAEFAVMVLGGATTCSGDEQQCVVATESSGIYSLEVDIGSIYSTSTTNAVIVVRSLTMNKVTYTGYNFCMII